MKYSVKCSIILVALLMAGLTGLPAEDLLKNDFLKPPASTRPWVYWFPTNGNLTKEGITADLEAMARVGIGGVLYVEVGQGEPGGKAVFAGPLWREMFQHACKEAARLGLEINMANGPSWGGSGGPWITPEFSMQNVVWSETVAEAGKKVDVVLPQPPTLLNYYRDVAVIAIPALLGDGIPLSAVGAKLTSTGAELKPGRFKLPIPEEKKPQSVTIEFPKPFTARMMSVSGSDGVIRGTLQASNDGAKFRQVRTFLINKSPTELPFAPVTARFFRLDVTRVDKSKQASVELFGLNLSPSYRIADIGGKAGFATQKFSPLAATFPSIPKGMAIDRDQIKDISANMDASGRLIWEAPSQEASNESTGSPRRWTVLRFGCTPKGQYNFPAPTGGSGLECDKFSVQAAKVAFDGLMAKVIADNKAGTGPGKTLVSTHIDSWECNTHNWTPLLREQFQQRRGYDLWKFLPVFTGRVVDNLEVSERFLWDLRQTYSDMVIDNYAGTFRKLANEHGLRLSIEAYGAVAADELAYGGQADEPMGEFWSWKKFDGASSCTEMASSAHTYGKNVVAAEAFTARIEEKWQGHPANIKDIGDWAFCEGINRFVFHRFAAQPWTNVAPGMGMGPWGLHYERTQTWWEQSKPWHEYLARCQHLLRQGLFVADVLYLQPEGAPRRFEAPADAWAAPNVRGGYNFDACTPEVVLTRLTAKDGRLVLPDGMNYRVLVVPPAETMTLRMLRKLKELADQGATIIANVKPPLKSPSLADHGEGDATVTQLTAALWPKLVTGKTAAQLLGERGIKPDFSAKPLLRYIHRATADTHLYFVANPEQLEVDAVAEFRVAGKQPELWWPDTGRTELAKEFEIKDGITRVPLRLDPSGSVFVIFREPAKAAKGAGKNWVETSPVQEIAGPWEVSFDPKWGGPAQPVRFDRLQDWSQHPDSGIKYYSGHAMYRTKFQAKKGKCLLDLGKVAIMAEVTLNAKPLGILWKPPYRVDVSDALADGENTLEVKVVNLWINRLIGDEQLPEDSERNPNGMLKAWPQWVQDGKPSPTGRYTFTTVRLWKKGDSLVESGLLGPVTIQSTEVIR